MTYALKKFTDGLIGSFSTGYQPVVGYLKSQNNFSLQINVGEIIII